MNLWTGRILLELSTADDPAWVYFDAQHKHVMDHLSEVYKTACLHVEGESFLHTTFCHDGLSVVALQM